MLAFIDESGTIHANDASPVSALVAVCMPERAHRGVSRRLHALKVDILKKDDDHELKAVEYINERTFRRIPEKKEVIECVFDLIAKGVFEITVFAIVTPRPTRAVDTSSDRLPVSHRYLLQRINAMADLLKQEAILVYDGDGMNIQGLNLSRCVRNYIFKVAEYRNILRRLVDTPLFVDSHLTPGIQLADLAASVVRQYEQHRLQIHERPEPAYVSAISRYYNQLKLRTRDDLLSDESHRLFGFYTVREESLYQSLENDLTTDEAN